MKKVIASGTIPVTICEDDFEGVSYQFLEIAVTAKTTERVKLKSPSSYELLAMRLAQTTTKS
ncbi:MAG: hypothetical protein LBC73_09060 [Oscillospiraceae bacterium]|nr:hypothetical protein [Oscillospiraceae bacterium]